MSNLPFAVAGRECSLIGEIGNAHNGVYENAVRLLDELKAAGAAAAKLQCYSADELVALRGDGPAPAQWSHMTMRELYSRAATPMDWFAPLYRHAASIGLPLFSSFFGLESLRVLESVGNPVYKLSAFEAWNPKLMGYAIATGKPVIASLRTLEKESAWTTDGRTYETLKVPSRDTNVHYLACSEGYPTKPEDVKLPPRFYGLFGSTSLVGVSSHCLSPELPIAARARGAQVMEFHVQLDDTPSVLEANVSLTVSQFKRMVESVRATEVLLG